MRRIHCFLLAALISGPSLAADTAVDMVALYRLRDEAFSKTAAGRRYTELFYAHTAEVTTRVLADTGLKQAVLGNLFLWQPHIRDLVDGKGSTAVVTSQQINGLVDVLSRLESAGSPELRAALQREKATLNLPSLVGQTMTQALAQQQTTAPQTVTIPASASIHGLGGAFFHTDLRVLNPSASAAASVTARFRCFTGPCPPAADKTFSVAPREMKVFDDVVMSLFGGPETAGPIELVGPVLAESRIYSPVKPAPSTGADVSGLSADRAYAESILLSLSRSADSSTGFRTNAGVYNPSPDALTVAFTVHRPDGTEIGAVTRAVGGKSAIQVNDVFNAAGITGDVADAYAIVKADGIHELFAYATVIDNQSQDTVFVNGRNARGVEPDVSTVAASASIHGVGSAFFHSDLRVFNPSRDKAVQVLASFRCYVGPCPQTLERTFTVAPREMKVLNDVDGTLFGAPETAGAIEVSGNVLVDSRIYTPNRPEPTSGTGIPGQARVEATTEAALLALSHSADQSLGFRTNLGIFNPGPFDLPVTISLRRPDGSEMGKVTRTVPPRTSVQVNDVFRTAGLSQDVANAWALVTANGRDTFFAYATVIDNRTQDSVFVRGRPLTGP